MFPINFNFPFRKSNGELTTIGKMIENAGGGGSYTLPTASANVKGGVKIGEGLEMDGEVLNATGGTPYELPTASANTLGGVKIGNGIDIDSNGVISVDNSSTTNLYNHNVKIVSGDNYFTVNVINKNNTPIDSINGFMNLFDVASGTEKQFNLLNTNISNANGTFTIDNSMGIKILSVGATPMATGTVTDNILEI